MSDKVKEDLMKTLSYYYDIKLNCKYLIYFNKQQPNSSKSHTHKAQSLSSSIDSIMMVITNGVECWTLCINDEKFLSSIIKTQLREKASFLEFLSGLQGSLKNEKFELNKILNTEKETNQNEESSEMIEFKFTLNNGDKNELKCNFLLEPIISSRIKATEIKNFLFFVYQKYTMAELEIKKYKNNLDNGQNSEIPNLTSSSGNLYLIYFVFIGEKIQ